MKLVNIILFYIILVLIQGLRKKGFVLLIYSVSIFVLCYIICSSLFFSPFHHHHHCYHFYFLVCLSYLRWIEKSA